MAPNCPQTGLFALIMKEQYTGWWWGRVEALGESLAVVLYLCCELKVTSNPQMLMYYIPSQTEGLIVALSLTRKTSFDTKDLHRI